MTPSWIAQLDVTAAFSLLGFVLITIPLFWLLRGNDFVLPNCGILKD